ncbi:MAG: alpha/beta hydrolase [Bryobacterales bacterium]|nr:alpha/beta hydrolase [Bryobacterales bacterium]
MPSFLRFLIPVFAASLVLAAEPHALKTPPHVNIPLWQAGKVPLASGDAPLDSPFLTVFLPRGGRTNGSAVVVAPGGGNIMMMYDVEGMQIAEQFNDWGAAAFVLTYRLEPYREDARALDGNRAVQVVRSRAKQWGVDPGKIGFIGFSAGSSLARLVGATAKPGDPAATDPVSKVGSRPDWLGLVYGPGRTRPDEDLKSFPPSFLLAAAWDKGAANGTVELFQQMSKAGAVAELHIYQKGRHGFGASIGSPEYGPWMSELRHFLMQGGFLPRSK